MLVSLIAQPLEKNPIENCRKNSVEFSRAVNCTAVLKLLKFTEVNPKLQDNLLRAKALQSLESTTVTRNAAVKFTSRENNRIYSTLR
jgi:hypothetical protein